MVGQDLNVGDSSVSRRFEGHNGGRAVRVRVWVVLGRREQRRERVRKREWARARCGRLSGFLSPQVQSKQQAGGGAARRRRPSGLKEEEEKKRIFTENPLDFFVKTKPLKQQLHIVK